MRHVVHATPCRDAGSHRVLGSHNPGTKARRTVMVRLLTCLRTLLATQARAQKQKRDRKRISWLLGIVVLGFIHLSCLALRSRGWSCAGR